MAAGHREPQIRYAVRLNGGAAVAPRGNVLKEGLKYHHIGIPTATPRDGEVYLEQFGMYASGFESSPYGVEWLRFEADSPLPQLVKTVPHVAFLVEDLEAAIEGQEVLIEPNSPSPGWTVAFIVDDGAPIEFLQIDESDE